MKKILIVLAAMLLAACNTQAKKEAPQAEEISVSAEANWVELTLNVEGMTCEGCENAIKAGVENLEGIALVESSHEEAWTKVKYDSNTTSAEAITASITETGYDVKGEI
jgi:copper chaperone CopZ